MDEMSFLAYHLHWSQADLMGLEHRDRRRWVQQVSALNQRVNEG